MDGYEPEEGFIIVLKIFTLFGMWPAAVKNPTWRFLYKIWGYVVHFSYNAALLPTQLISMYITRDDLHKLINSSFFTFTIISYVVKIIYIFSQRKKIEQLFERLRSPIFAPRREEHLTVLRKTASTATWNSIIFISLCLLTCVWWIMFPFVDSKQEKVLLYGAWYPFDYTKNAYYPYTFIFQASMLLTTAAVDSMMDMLVTNFYLAMVAQIEMLKIDFKFLTDIVVNQQLFSVSSNSTNSTTSIKRPENGLFHEGTILTKFKRKGLLKDTTQEEVCLINILKERIANYTNHYVAILTFVQDVTEMFQIGIVVQVCASCIVICVTCFELSLISPGTLQFYVMIQYQICMLVEIFCYTWRGNNITVKTSELKDAVYECAWTSVSDKNFRKSLCIIMSRLQIPVKVCVGNFFFLSVETFFGILRSAYSFYVLLKQMQAKKN